MSPRASRMALQALSFWDRKRLQARAARTPGLEIDPGASSNLAVARFSLARGARLQIASGVVCERLPGALRFILEEDAEVVIGPGTWLRVEVAPVHLVAFRGARIEIGPEGFLNGCHVSAKRQVEIGRRSWVGTGSRIYDSDQHDFDADRPEESSPVTIGDYSWIASDCTILKGVHIGSHSIVGTRSLVSADIDDHTLAFGAPARARGTVGDRTRTS